MTKFYPININLQEKLCVVIGGGNVAERKVKRLLESKAIVKVISPAFSAGLKVLDKANKLTLNCKRAAVSDLKNAYLVISAADDRALNSKIYAYCTKNNIPVNVVDYPSECDFILPSIVSRGDLTVTISTGGASPALSKKIRKDLEKVFGKEYSDFLKIMKKLRPEVIKKIGDLKKRKIFFERIVQSNVLNDLRKGKKKQVKQKLEQMLQND